MTLQMSELKSRDDLVFLLNRTGRIGNAVEVGTHQADFARHILHNWKGEKLYCIDPWCIPPGYEYEAQFLSNSSNREQDFQIALEKLHQFGERAIPLRLTSFDAAHDLSWFASESLDFVFIDARHSYEGVKEDLNLWYPKLKTGGIMAGHDFVCPRNTESNWGTAIQPAVMEFAAEKQLDVWLIVEPEFLPWSYYMIKP